MTFHQTILQYILEVDSHRDTKQKKKLVFGMIAIVVNPNVLSNLKVSSIFVQYTVRYFRNIINQQ